MQRSLDDLRPEDFAVHSIWVVDAEDEMILHSFDPPHDQVGQLVLKCFYSDSDGKLFLGYVYWDASLELKRLCPVMFIGENGDQISFWSGIRVPSEAELDQLLTEAKLPIHYRFQSPSGITHEGDLTGIYFLRGTSVQSLP